MKRCTVCDATSSGNSIYHEEIVDYSQGELFFTDDGHGNTICSRCSDIILDTLSEMEEADEMDKT